MVSLNGTTAKNELSALLSPFSCGKGTAPYL